MTLGRPWTPGKAKTRKNEDELLEKYFEQNGGLLFTEVNVAYPVTGSRQRRLDAIRVPDPPYSDTGAYRYGSKNRATIWKFVENHPVELIEVHGWGFHAFGQVVGKAGVLREFYDPYELQKTVIVNDNLTSYHPDEQPDPATEAVFDEYDIKIVVID